MTDEQMSELKGYIREQIEGLETRILTQFYKWARPVEARLRRLELSDSVVDERIAGLEGRILTLEERLLKG